MGSGRRTEAQLPGPVGPTEPLRAAGPASASVSPPSDPPTVSAPHPVSLSSFIQTILRKSVPFWIFFFFF